MNYFDFCNLMKPKTTEERLLENTEQLSKNLDRVLKIIEHQNEMISMLNDIVYKLAPDIEIIETMAENPEEEADMIAKYMNHGKYTE